MKFDEREFLKEMLLLTIESIGERRVIISDSVSQSLPRDHPLQKMRVMLTDRLRRNNGIKKETDLAIRKAALLRSSGKKWSEVEQEFELSFVRDLRSGRRYSERFNLWLNAFKIK